MAKQILKTSAKSLGPYSTGAWAGDTLFVSGQIAYSAEEERIILDSIPEETHQIMKNIKGILEIAGLTWNDVVKTSIFLTDMGNFSTVNEVYAQYFDIELAPARECVQVAALPGGVNVEISVIATK
ncbi:MAG: Rid family detoxifying hydrolase [Saprospiraceae bacterium]|nr:Rid family detoxifying hydrolase [Saprospiraceae bacterium]